jgi:LysM repeat protein
MDDPRYDSEYDDYDDYEDVRVTNVGLPAGQLALIIGVNAVISLVISISVVLIAGRQVLPGDVAMPVAGASKVTAQSVEGEQSEAGAPSEASGEGGTSAGSTPIQTVTYIVEPGDTLSLIAQKFAVSVSDLMIANGLTNQDFIQAGQELIIPVGGLTTPTPTFTPVPSPTDTPLPFEPPTPIPTETGLPPEPAVTVGPSPTSTHTPKPTPVQSRPLPPPPLAKSMWSSVKSLPPAICDGKHSSSLTRVLAQACQSGNWKALPWVSLSFLTYSFSAAAAFGFIPLPVKTLPATFI